jgi:hypothetical protein
MSLYKEFSTLFPYIQSVRKIETYLSFDISFPKTWKIPKKYVDETKIMEQQSSINDERLFSYVSEFNETDVEKTYQNISNIIKYNKEREDKDKLFENKVNELKQIFEKQNLEKLKGLSFEIQEPIIKKIKFEEDDGESETNRMVEQGETKG